MRFLSLFLAFAICSSSVASVQGEEKSEVITIPDASLRAVLLELKKKRQKEGEDITLDDLKNVYFLMAEGREIADLTGLEHCSNLGEARLGRNKIQNVAPLAKCQNLQSLSLQENQIEDVAPLGSLAKLQYLNFEHNRVRSIAGLQSLQALTSLYVSHNEIESLEGVSSLKKLWTVSLNHNRISDVSPLAELPRLSTVGLAHNQIVDVAKLPPGNTTYATYLQGNRIQDLSPLVSLAEADAAGPKRFAAFWRLYLADNPLNEAESMKQLDALRSHGVRIDLEYNK